MWPNTNLNWPWLFNTSATRPFRTIPWEQKGELYDNQCLRFYLSSVRQPQREFYLSEYAQNLSYVSNDVSSWGSAAQIREFIGDENMPTGRLPWRRAVMQPMHTRLVGAADNISVSAKAVSWTSNVAVRKETALYDRLLKTQAAAMGGPLAEAMAAQGVGMDEDAERDRFENLWTDPYERAMTNLVLAMGEHQKLARMQRKAASNLALSGVCAVHQFANGNNIEAELCEPHEVGWDTDAIRPDFSDGEYCYHMRPMDVAALAEQYQPSKDTLILLEQWANMPNTSAPANASWGWPMQKPLVVTCYFKDIRTIERGFVLKDGEPHYCTINIAGPDGKVEYTDADLIDPPVNQWTSTWTNMEIKMRKQVKEVQRLRYCSVIPWEYMPASLTKYSGVKGQKIEPFKSRSETLKLDVNGQKILQTLSPTGDLILDNGEYELQEYDPDDKYHVALPIKFGSWMYLNGLPIAPLSCIRDIQGMMNAVLSDMMMRMSRAEMPTTVFDNDSLVAAGISSDQAVRNLKVGRAFGIKSMLVGGVNQAIKTTETGLGADFYQRFTIIDRLYQMAQDATGIYDQNFGAPGSEDMLVRVKEMQSRQSGIMLTPFYAALGDLFEQVNQGNAQAGKIFFSSRPWALNQMVGDEGERIILLSKGMTDEQFRVKIKLTTDTEQQQRDVETAIFQQGGYLDRGLLDAREAAKLLASGALMDEMKEGAARFTKRMQEAEKMKAEQQQQAMQAQTMAAADAELSEREMELSKMGVDAGLKQQQIQAKAMTPVVSALSKNLEPMEKSATLDVNV